MSRSAILYLILALLLHLTRLAAADDTSYDKWCGKSAQAEARKVAQKHFVEATNRAQLKAMAVLEAQATELSAKLPDELIAAGRTRGQARAKFDEVNARRAALQEQRMALGEEPKGASWAQAALRTSKYRAAMKEEMELDDLYVEWDSRLTRTSATLDHLATTFAGQLDFTRQYDRAFAYDDRKHELRLCAPPVSGLMLDVRYCADFDLETGSLTYGLHKFASYSNVEPLQSDQVLWIDFGALPPTRFLATKANRAELYDRIRRDELPDSCYR